MSKHSKITIVGGAGAIGLIHAWRLAAAGHEITVLDSHSADGTGKSFSLLSEAEQLTISFPEVDKLLKSLPKGNQFKEAFVKMLTGLPDKIPERIAALLPEDADLSYEVREKSIAAALRVAKTKLRLVQNAKDIGTEQDLILVTTKNAALNRPLAKKIKEIPSHPQTPVLVFANGVMPWIFADSIRLNSLAPIHEFVDTIGARRIVGGVAEKYAARVLGPGKVRSGMATQTRNYVGLVEQGGGIDHVRTILEIYSDTGLSVESANIKEAVITKLGFNLITSLFPSVFGTEGFGQVLDLHLQEAMRHVAYECFGFAKKMSVQLAASAEDYARERIANIQKIAPVIKDTPPSALQDLRRGKLTERNEYLVAILELAEDIGISVPNIRAMNTLMEQVEYVALKGRAELDSLQQIFLDQLKGCNGNLTQINASKAKTLALRTDFEGSLGEILSRFSDGSLKVGIQGLDSNKWHINEYLPILKAYAAYAETLCEYTGFRVPLTDVWGGGQVSNVPRFLGEDPLHNLQKMRETAPDLRFKCIYRGRQGFGFGPCSTEIHQTFISEAIADGMQGFRAFDPMHDVENLKVFIDIINERRNVQRRKGVGEDRLASAEGLVFYVKPPENTELVWTSERCAVYAVELAEAGFHEVSLADYGGQIPNPETAFEYVSVIRTALEKKGLSHINVNFFAQGTTAEIVQATIKAGAKYIDTAFGALSGHTSNPDMMVLLKSMMEEKGFDIDAEPYRDHPTIAALKNVENLINTASQKHIPYRMLPSDISADELSESRMALNAIPALHSAIIKNWESLIKPALPEKFLREASDHPQLAYLKLVLKKSPDLWKAAGQFNPVSPLGFVLSFQAEFHTRRELSGKKVALGEYREAYRGIMLGRLGRNHGIEAGIGDVELAKAFHIYEALIVLLTNRSEIGDAKIERFFECAGLSTILCLQYPEDSTHKILLSEIRSSQELEASLRKADLERVKTAIAEISFQPDIAHQLEHALSRERYPEPKDGIKEGEEIVGQLEMEGLSFSNAPVSEGRLSERERAAMLIVALKAEGQDPFFVGKNLFRHLQDPEGSLYGDIEPDIRPFDKALSREIISMGTLMAKKRALQSVNVLIAGTDQAKISKNATAISKIDVQWTALQTDVRGKICSIAETSCIPGTSEGFVERGLITFHTLSSMAAEKILPTLLKIPPSMWKQSVDPGLHPVSKTPS